MPAMSDGAALKTVKVRLSCSSEAVFLRDVAPRLAGRFWIESEAPLPAGEKVSFTLELEPGGHRVSGTANVVASEPVRMCLRLVELDGGGVQFALGREGSAPDDVLLPGRWRERPHPFTEAPTPAFGTPVPKLVLPSAATPAPV